MSLIRKYESWREKSRKKAIIRSARDAELYEAQYKAAKAKAKLEKVRRKSGGGFASGFGAAIDNFGRNIESQNGPYGGRRKRKKRDDFGFF